VRAHGGTARTCGGRSAHCPARPTVPAGGRCGAGAEGGASGGARAAARRDGHGGGHAGGCRSPIHGGSDLAGGRMASEKIEKIGVREER
jgi:hypothetical protein